jgi:hypothetical protein
VRADDPLEPFHSRLREAVARGETLKDDDGELLGELDDALTALRGEPKHPFIPRMPNATLCSCGRPDYAPCHRNTSGLPIEV